MVPVRPVTGSGPIAVRIRSPTQQCVLREAHDNMAKKSATLRRNEVAVWAADDASLFVQTGEDGNVSRVWTSVEAGGKSGWTCAWFKGKWNLECADGGGDLPLVVGDATVEFSRL